MKKIANIELTRGNRGRAVPLGENINEDVIKYLLEEMKMSGIEFCFYDPEFPSPSDPGAYFSYSPSSGLWRMTLGNHGWSGGIYIIGDQALLTQLQNLHFLGLLKLLELEGVCFFSHYASETDIKNKEMNDLILQIHGKTSPEIRKAVLAIERVLEILERYAEHSQGNISEIKTKLTDIKTGNRFKIKEALFAIGGMCHPKWLGDVYISGMPWEEWSSALNDMHDACAMAFNKLDKKLT